MHSKKTALMIGGAGVAINVIDAYTAMSKDSAGNSVVDPSKGMFYGANGPFKSFPKMGFILIAIGAVLYFKGR